MEWRHQQSFFKLAPVKSQKQPSGGILLKKCS